MVIGQSRTECLTSFKIFSVCIDRSYPTEPWIDIAYISIVPILSVLGVIHEICVLLTIHFGNLKESPYIYLKCISWSDLFLLVLTIADCGYRWIIRQLNADTVLNIKVYYWSVSLRVLREEEFFAREA